ncbi:methyltransferase family protein [Bradyrhizobium acaciae]|uniref:methyltransferase family protein n=1 Tax=Bradyrhizobium acaciae TaxID=2683706 RepID=UPI001E29B107|nr:isoprenylcysteine carboxylmethyltransferase family protein [Bradyrhizobium acaciae]MCC8982938.1 isoprenylcysteine carboxylmethyltransferase family protein [Bradyrhizobium acaciae]
MNETSNPPRINPRRAAFTLVGLGTLLFLAAGTMRWAGAWVFLLEITIGGLITEAWLARHDPGLLAERRTSRGQVGWDRIITSIMPLLWLMWLPLMALDAARYQTLLVPFWLQCAGALMIAASFYIVYRTYRENSYAAPVVKIQRERGHTAVTTGPYAYVRHPIYAGGLLTYLGTPLLLGSWYGLAIVPVMAALLGLRSMMEERMLTAELDGYADYLERVRYRLVPMVW